MISEKMYELGSKRSVIRELFEFGKIRAAEIGAENVFDFSLGNPNVPPPASVKNEILRILETEEPGAVHGYTSAQGDAGVRKAIADSLNSRFGASFNPDRIYMTVGAAASISICFRALAKEGDEFIAFAPFFPEYRCFVEAAGGTLKVVPADTESFQINFDELEKRISGKTKAVIVNSPNNPSGAVYSEETIERLASLLERKSAETGRTIFLISDEPYREIVYDDLEIPFLTKYYPHTFVCYSFSKALSLPGERIGYIALPEEMVDVERVYAAVCGAGRALGYVCAPSLFQRVAASCACDTSDIAYYRKNRDLLYEGITRVGFQAVKPKGAFYLFMRSPESDANAFCERAKAHDLLLVPGDSFGCPSHVRISYCVAADVIRRSLPAFEALAAEYGLV